MMTGVPLVNFLVKPLGIWMASISRVRTVTGESVLIEIKVRRYFSFVNEFLNLGMNLASYIDCDKKMVLSFSS